MKEKQMKKIFLIILLFMALIFISNIAYAKTSTITNMDIQATINQDGSLHVSQKVTYDFKGSFNGTYITIPLDFDDSEYKKEKSEFDENLYNGSSVEINKVSCNEIIYKEVYAATNGDGGVYTQTDEDNLTTIKVFSPSNNERKTFNFDYTIKNVAVKHNDCGELYWNFIGKDWQTSIKKLNIDLYLPENYDFINLYVWAHGPYSGISKKISSTQLNFTLENIRPGQYVAARTIFPVNNISASNKITNIDAKEKVFEEEVAIENQIKEKEDFNIKIILLSMVLLIYWLVLIFIYEKDKIYLVNNINEEELFEKYNPLIAGCIQGSRGILARDIIAVILNLSNKNVVSLELVNTTATENNYEYMISKVSKNEGKMDEIEKYVYDWFFGDYTTKNFVANNEVSLGRVPLSQRLKDMPKEQVAANKFEKLNKLAMQRLNDLGANKSKVPVALRTFNNIIFIVCLIVSLIHIQYNGLNIYIPSSIGQNIGALFFIMLEYLPFTLILILIPVKLIMNLRHSVNGLIQKITGQKMVTTSIAIILIWLAVIILTGLFKISNYLILDEILICIGMLIIFTDNLMLKNEVTMIEDFSRLNSLKYKIEQYTLMNDKDVQHVVLWDKYLTYSISFGITSKIMQQIKGLNIDDDLIELMNTSFSQNYIYTEYSYFYEQSSLDKRYRREYRRNRERDRFYYDDRNNDSFSSSFNNHSRSFGSGGGFSGGSSFHGGGGRHRRWRSFLEKLKLKSYNLEIILLIREKKFNK